MTVPRGNRAEVRNPVLALPALAKARALPPEAREAVRALLADIAAAAGDQAQRSWRANKGPMAAYWKAVGAYAKHIRNALRAGR